MTVTIDSILNSYAPPGSAERYIEIFKPVVCEAHGFDPAISLTSEQVRELFDEMLKPGITLRLATLANSALASWVEYLGQITQDRIGEDQLLTQGIYSAGRALAEGTPPSDQRWSHLIELAAFRAGLKHKPKPSE